MSAGLIATSSVEELFAAPVGRCFVGGTYAIWCYAANLQGAIVWGALDHLTIRHVISILGLVRAGAPPRRRIFVDLRAIEQVDAEVLLDFATRARDSIRRCASVIERQAFVVPNGIDGLLLTGALSSLGFAHPLRFSRELAPALAFLDHPAARKAHESATALAEATRGDAILIARLHAQLRTDLVDATVGSIAKALGMSARSLQRALTRLRTSFRDELRRVRVSVAEKLLVESDRKIDAVASAVGFGSASRMSAVLRREKNVTATALRAHQRRALA